MRSIISGMYSDMSAVFTEIFGQTYDIDTESHGIVSIEGVYRPENVEISVGDHGMSQRMPWPRIDFRRDQLFAAGLTDPENDLHGAQIVIDGRIANISDPEDDGRVMVRCRVSKTAASAS